MLRYVQRRLLQLMPTLLGVLVVVFLLVRISGDPTQLLLPQTATLADRALYRHQHGLDQPLPIQFLHYIASVARGDLGRSLVDARPALQVVLQRLPATIELTADDLREIEAGAAPLTAHGERYPEAAQKMINR